MENLCELVNSLRPSEIRALKASYLVKERSNPDLRLVLLEFILKKRRLTDEEACRFVYKSFPGSAFSHLKNRLWEDICSLLALQDANTGDAVAAARTEVNKLLTVARALKERGLPFQSFDLSKQALEKALKHTLVPELLGLKDFVSTSFPDFWQKERPKVLSLLSRTVKEESDRLEAANIVELATYDHDPERYVAELNLIYRRSSCEQIKSLVHRSMIRLHLEQRNSDHLFNECILLYSLNMDKDQQGEGRNMQEMYSDITRAALHESSFGSAVDFAKAGLSIEGEDLKVKIDLLEGLMIACINLSLFEKCHDVIKKYEDIVTNNPQTGSRDLRFSYLKSWLYFLSGDYRSSLRTVASTDLQQRKKEVWHAGFYVIELMNLMKQRTYFQLDYKIENFRKYLVRHELWEHELLKKIYRAFKRFVDNDYSIEGIAELLADDGSYKRNIETLDVVDILNCLRVSCFSSSDQKDAGLLMNVR